MVLLLLLALYRGVDLAREGWQPTAKGEARWFDWAWGTVAERSLLPDRDQASESGLPPSRLLVFEVAPEGVREAWVQVMTQYALPGRVVAGVRVGDLESGSPELPDGASLVPLTAEGQRLAPGPHAVSRRLLGLFTIALGCAVTLLTGLLLLSPRANLGEWLSELPLALPLALPLGLSLAVPLTAAVSIAGLPLWVGAVLAPPLALAMGKRRAPVASRSDGWAAPHGGLHSLLLGLLGLLLTLFLVRICLAPLWSWDHFSTWGMKARRIHAVGLGAHTFAGPEGAFGFANGHYPLGLPLAWLHMALGSEPTAWLFRWAHGLFGVALVLLVRRAARAVGASAILAGLAACLTAASPLFWDTESLGLAEMALALWSVAAVAAALDVRRGAARQWTAGLLLGYLCWLKPEGLVLTLPLVLVLWWWSRARRDGLSDSSRPWARRAVVGARLGGPALLFAFSSVALGRVVAAPSVSFLRGDPWGRAVARLPEMLEILRLLATELLAREWLGGWLLVVAGLAVATLRRRPLPAALTAVVLAQLGVYASIYFVSYLEPEHHIPSSFFRIAAGLLPLALVATAAALAKGRPLAGLTPAPSTYRTRRPGPAAAPRPS